MCLDMEQLCMSEEIANRFDYLVDIEEVKLKNTNLLYTDDRNGMTTQAQGLNLDL